MMRHVFYAGQHYGSWTLQVWVGSGIALTIPDGAYLLMTEGPSWYHKKSGSFEYVIPSDVPPELKTLCLLLDIPL